MRVLVLAFLAFIASNAFAEEFKPGCTLPFAAIEKKQDIDASCGQAACCTEPDEEH